MRQIGHTGLFHWVMYIHESVWVLSRRLFSGSQEATGERTFITGRPLSISPAHRIILIRFLLLANGFPRQLGQHFCCSCARPVDNDVTDTAIKKKAKTTRTRSLEPKRWRYLTMSQDPNQKRRQDIPSAVGKTTFSWGSMFFRLFWSNISSWLFRSGCTLGRSLTEGDWASCWSAMAAVVVD